MKKTVLSAFCALAACAAFAQWVGCSFIRVQSGEYSVSFKAIKLLALDMDGTLLTTDKRLTARAKDALGRASAAGVWIVPATGRIFMGLPEAVRALPYLRYARL